MCLRVKEKSREELSDAKQVICHYESNQQNANLQVNLLFQVGSTCFRRCFRPSSGELVCI